MIILSKNMYYYKIIFMIEKIIGKRIRLESVRMLDFMNIYTLVASIEKKGNISSMMRCKENEKKRKGTTEENRQRL